MTHLCQVCLKFNNTLDSKDSTSKTSRCSFHDVGH